MHEPSPWPGHCDTAGLRSAASPARRCHCRVTSLPAPVAARIPGEKPLFALCFKSKRKQNSSADVPEVPMAARTFLLCSSPGFLQSPRRSRVVWGAGKGHHCPAAQGTQSLTKVSSQITGHTWGLGIGDTTQEFWDGGQMFQNPDWDFIHEPERITILCVS